MQHAHLVEGMVLQPVDEFGLEGRDLAGHAERAVIHVASGAAGDLAKLCRREIAMALPVELAHAGEGDMVEIEIESHADGVGRHQEIDIAILIEGNLRIARARAKRAEHHRRAAALASHQLGDGIDVAGREADDGRTARQPRDLLVAGIGELRQARARHQIGAGQELADRIAHGGGPEQKRLAQAPGVKQAIGEDMAALAVGGELNLVDGHEVGLEFERHGLDGADIEARGGRLDLLLAGDERNLARAGPRGDLVVDFARQAACNGSPMIPISWASMRSMARWVLPVLVGPSTAVTPRPRWSPVELVENRRLIS